MRFLAELGYCPKTHTLREVVDRVTGLLNPHKSRSNPTKKARGDSSLNGHAVGANGYVGSNGYANGSKGKSASSKHITGTNEHTNSNGFMAPEQTTASSVCTTQKKQR